MLFFLKKRIKIENIKDGKITAMSKDSKKSQTSLRKVSLGGCDSMEGDAIETSEKEYEVLEREIFPEKIICPDCGGITLEGLDYCDKCGGEL